MCRLQHSLGIVWRPQTPPLTAPTSNGSRQPCRQGPGATRPSSHAGRSGRCQSIAWGRGSTRDSEGGYWGRLQRRTGAGRYRIEAGGRPCACLPWTSWRSRRCPGTGARCSGAAPPAAEKPCAAAPQGGRAGAALAWSQPGGLRLRAWPFPPWPAPLKAKAKPPGSAGAPRPGRRGLRRAWVPHSARPPHCARSAGPVRPAPGTRTVGARTLRELLCYLEGVNVF